MKSYKIAAFALALSTATLMTASNAKADELNRETRLTFDQPVEVPGHVLPAGSYVFRLLDADHNSNIVEIREAGSFRLVTTVATVEDELSNPAKAHQYVSFVKTGNNSPQAIAEWYYPGSSVGLQFMYPKQERASFAKHAQMNDQALGD